MIKTKYMKIIRSKCCDVDVIPCAKGECLCPLSRGGCGKMCKYYVNRINAMTINIFESSDGGYIYDIYDCEADDIDKHESLDGGLCTTTIQNALEMAFDQAKDLLNNKNIN